MKIVAQFYPGKIVQTHTGQY